jgi:ubiquinone/menaquinone biosynthesis C-methylase UbiE
VRELNAASKIAKSISNASSSDQIKHFNKLAGTYDQTSYTKQAQMDILLLRNYVDIHEGMLVLDMGTGTGKVAVGLLSEFDKIRLTGIDFSKNMLLLAQQKAKEKNLYSSTVFALANFLKLPFENNVFDLVLITYSLHHVPSKLRTNAVREAVRVLRNRGYLAILEVGPNHYKEAIDAYSGPGSSSRTRLSNTKLEQLLVHAQLDLECSVSRQEWYYLSLQEISEYLTVQGIVNRNEGLYSKLHEKLTDPQKITVHRILLVGKKTRIVSSISWLN